MEAWNSLAYCWAVMPVSEDLNGTVGVHQASVTRFLPSGPSALTTLGNSSALAMAAIRGVNPCWLHCFQNVRKSGGSGQPKTISTSCALYLLMIEVKSVAPSG